MKNFKPKSKACYKCWINQFKIMILVAQQKKRHVLIGHFKAYSKTKFPIQIQKSRGKNIHKKHYGTIILMESIMK